MAFDHIPLTRDDDQLLPYNFDEGEEFDSKEKINHASTFVHAVCRGWMDLKRSSRTSNVLHCRQCGLRVALPRSIETIGEMDTYLRSRLEVAEPRLW